MAHLLTGTSDLPTDIQGFYDRVLLKRSVASLLYGLFGDIARLPKNMGERVAMRRIESLAVNTTKLIEGVTPTGKKVTQSMVYATVSQYGDFVRLTDWVLLTGLDPNLTGVVDDVLGEQMGLTFDTIHRDHLMVGTSVRYGGGVAARASIVTAIAKSDIEMMVRMLEGANAKKISRQIVAGDRIGTRPVASGYYGIAHTDLRADSEALPGFIKKQEYASQKNVRDEEIGECGGIRVLTTTNGKVFRHEGGAVGATGLLSEDSANVDVYTLLVYAKNFFSTVPLQGGSSKSITKKLGRGDDPLDQRQTTGWKGATVAKITNENNGVRGEFGCTSVS